ncbi:MAG TPA: hypothetical protein VIT20_00845 [Propionibacteriaceae bacterium]
MTKIAATVLAAACLLGLSAGPAAAATSTPLTAQSGWLCAVLRIKC